MCRECENKVLNHSHLCSMIYHDIYKFEKEMRVMKWIVFPTQKLSLVLRTLDGFFVGFFKYTVVVMDIFVKPGNPLKLCHNCLFKYLKATLNIHYTKNKV